MKQKIITYTAYAIVIALGVLLISACSEQPAPPSEDSINNSIVAICNEYRTADAVDRQDIEHDLERILVGYTGRIDQDAEYCLNAMDVQIR